MVRANNYDFISSRLSALIYEVQMNNRLNLTHLNVHSEDLFCRLLHAFYGWDLENINQITQNEQGIDLIDKGNKIFVQVTSTKSMAKLKKSLKSIPNGYQGYRFKFLAIEQDAENLRKGNYTLPNGLSFDPKKDVLDISTLLRDFKSKDIDEQKTIVAVVREELSDIITKPVRTSDLSEVIKIISKSPDIVSISGNVRSLPSGIQDKLNFNSLKSARRVVARCMDNQRLVDNVYSDYQQTNGGNKRAIVLNTIISFFEKRADSLSGDELFNAIRKDLSEFVDEHSEYIEMTEEEIQISCDMLIVDAFISCHIFDNPNSIC